MARDVTKAEALIIEYPYSENEFDICSGYKTRHFTGRALLLEFNDCEVIILRWMAQTNFVRVIRKSDGSTVYRFQGDFPLPENINSCKIVKKIEINVGLAFEIVNAIYEMEKIVTAQENIRKAKSEATEILKINDVV